MIGTKKVLLFCISCVIFDLGTCISAGKKIENDKNLKAITKEASFFVQVVASNLLQTKLCGGALISPRLVLTDQECIQNVQKAGDISVFGGSDINKANLETRTAFDSDYESGIGIIMIDPFSNNITPVPMANETSAGNRNAVYVTYGMSRSIDSPKPLFVKLTGQLMNCTTRSNNKMCVNRLSGRALDTLDAGSPLINEDGELVAVSTSKIGKCSAPPNYVGTWCDHYTNVHENQRFIQEAQRKLSE